jgi:quinol monooxygenase YgiN
LTAGPFVHQGFGATRPTASEAGCVRFDVLQDTSNPDRYYFYEVYQDEAAFQAHTQTPHLTRRRDVQSTKPSLCSLRRIGTMARVDMAFAGGVYMTPEAADAFAYGLVNFVRSSQMWRRAQLCQIEEKLLIESARARQTAEASMADRDSTPWSSGRTPYQRSSEASSRKARR